MRTLFAVLMAFTLTGLSGCLAGDGTITAKDGLGPARDAARDLVDAAPQLIGVSSLEPFREYILDEPDDDIEVHVYLDDEPGDGKAPGWVYLFTADDDMVAIGYASGLGVLFTVREGGNEGASEAAITGWNTDSDDAARALKDHPDWPAPDDSSTLFWELMQEDDCPVWTVEQIEGPGIGFGNSTTGRVDACTGQVLEVVEKSGGWSCSEGWSQGTSTVLPLLPGNEYTAYLVDQGTVMFEVAYGAGVGDVSYTVEGPDGIVDQGTGPTQQTLTDMPPGEYVLSIDGDIGVRQAHGSISATSCS